MKPSIRIIPRLDVKGPNIIKGIQLDGHRVLGNVHYFSELYYQEGADELFFQDTVASLYRRNNLIEVVKRASEKVFIPITVAGGIRSVEDIRALLKAGADKVAINTAATENPMLLKEASDIFGSQSIVASLEVFQRKNGNYEIWCDYGRQPTGLDAFEWAQKVVEMGVGEIYLTSINKDGVGLGYDLELTKKISDLVSVPVVACSGAGNVDHVKEVIEECGVSAISAASLFHYKYIKKIEGPTLNFHEEALRMGAQVDSGNIDFLNHGYGGQQAIMVTPASINEVKNSLKEHSLNIR
jgi:cyclase